MKLLKRVSVILLATLITLTSLPLGHLMGTVDTADAAPVARFYQTGPLRDYYGHVYTFGRQPYMGIYMVKNGRYAVGSATEVPILKGYRIKRNGWIITRPKDVSDEEEANFFKACYEFLAERYGGEKNVISAEVHKDESGEPHIHFCFVPVAKYEPNQNLVKVVRYVREHPGKNQTEIAAALGISRKTVRRYQNCTDDDILYEKLSAREVINKYDLVTFHKDLQKFLNRKGIKANVNSGITRKRGGNMTVEQLKMQREYLKEHGDNIDEIIENIDKSLSDVVHPWEL